MTTEKKPRQTAEKKPRQILECEYHPGEELVIRLRAPRLQGRDAGPVAQHLMEAQKEFLAAMKSLLDAAVAFLEVEEQPPARRRGRIKVE
ncbi:MAG: hypothetical protein HY687_05950 [Chloroflexi bacterium]|nr:hypothetical protein [Chloroflexota bacterium]